MTLPPIAPRASAERKPMHAQQQDEQEEDVRDLPSVADLASVRRALAVVRAACALVEEGASRATATQIAQQAERSGVFLEAWEVGQIAARCGMRTRASHGKSRFVLDLDQLTDLRGRLAKMVEEVAPLLEQEMATFDGLAAQVEALRERVLQVQAMQADARRYQDFIERTRGMGRIVENYREQAAGLKQQAETADKYGPYIAQLEEKAAALPKLKQRANDLKQRVADAEAQTKDLDQQEKAVARTEAANAQRATSLGRKAEEVTRRAQTLDLAEMEQQTADARKELDGVLKQLGEKKGLLSKMFGGGGQT